jgi:hypothetical protein
VHRSADPNVAVETETQTETAEEDQPEEPSDEQRELEGKLLREHMAALENPESPIPLFKIRDIRKKLEKRDEPWAVELLGRVNAALNDHKLRFDKRMFDSVAKMGKDFPPPKVAEQADQEFMYTYYHHPFFGAHGCEPSDAVDTCFAVVSAERQRIFSSYKDTDPKGVEGALASSRFQYELQSLAAVRSTVSFATGVITNLIGNQISTGWGNLIGNWLESQIMQKVDLKLLAKRIEILENAPDSLPDEEKAQIEEEIVRLLGLLHEPEKAIPRPDGGVVGAADKADQVAGEVEDAVTDTAVSVETLAGTQASQAMFDDLLAKLALVSQACRLVVAGQAVSKLRQQGNQVRALEEEHSLRGRTSQDLEKAGLFDSADGKPFDPKQGLVYRYIPKSDKEGTLEEIIRAPQPEEAAG